jgi:hypothetical protein
MIRQFVHQMLELALFGPAQAAHDAADARGVAFEDTGDQFTAGRREFDLAHALIIRHRPPGEEASALEAIDDTGNARRLDEEPLAELAETQTCVTFGLGALEGPQDAPLGAADAMLGEVGLHERTEEAGGSHETPPSPGRNIDLCHHCEEPPITAAQQNESPTTIIYLEH